MAEEATNSGVVEDADVTWVPKRAVRLISLDTIFPPILAVLEEQT